MAFLSSLFSAISAIPKLIDAINMLLGAMEKHRKELELARINEARTEMNKAETSDEIQKAAEKTADAFRNL